MRSLRGVLKKLSTRDILAQSLRLAPTSTPGMVSSDFCKLPQEIIDRIIDHLHEDKASLLSASKSHRLLRPSCLYHLLVIVVINLDGYAMNKLEAALARLPDGAGFITYVRSLVLVGASTRTVRWQDVQLFSRFTSVTLLRLQLVTFDSSSVFQHLLSSLTSLNELNIKGFLGIKHHICDTSAFPQSPRLRVLALDPKVLSDSEEALQYCDNRFMLFIEWLGETQSTQSQASVRKVSLQCLTSHQIALAQKILSWKSPLLDEIALILTGMSFQTFMSDHCTRFASHGPLSTESPVTKLTIHLDSQRNAICIVMALLHHVRIVSLRTIKVVFSGHWSHGISKWTPMRILPLTDDEPQFNPVALKSLEGIEIVFDQVSRLINLEALLERFAVARSQGIQIAILPEKFDPLRK